MRTVVCIIGMWMWVWVLHAQTGYYSETKTFYEDGYTYQCDVENGVLATLYNKDVKYYGKVKIDKRTGEEYEFHFENPPHIEDETWSKPKAFEIVNRAFSAEQKAQLQGDELLIGLYIDSQTGKIADVVFDFPAVAGMDNYHTIPVSVYRQIEVELKKNVWFTPTEEGKNLSYIYMFWTQDPNVTLRSNPRTPLGPPLKPGNDSLFDDNIRREDETVVNPRKAADHTAADSTDVGKNK